MQTTSLFSSNNLSTIWLPIKPAPPVTNILIFPPFISEANNSIKISNFKLPEVIETIEEHKYFYPVSKRKGVNLNSAFLEKKKKEVRSALGKNNKTLLELVLGLALYGYILFSWHLTAWRVEWVWRVTQVLLPLAISLTLRRSLKSIRFSIRDFGKNILLGLAVGVIAGSILSFPIMKWASPLMAKNLNSLSEIIYVLLLITSNIAPIEYFYRGFLQPRMEVFTGPISGAIFASILYGFDFWEYHVFNIPILIGVGIVFGSLYLKTRSLTAPILAHFSFFLTVMAIISI